MTGGRAARWSEYVALVVAFGLTGIVWWTIAPTWWPDADENLLVVGEVVFQLTVILGGAYGLRALRRRLSAEPADLDP